VVGSRTESHVPVPLWQGDFASRSRARSIKWISRRPLGKSHCAALSKILEGQRTHRSDDAPWALLSWQARLQKDLRWATAQVWRTAKYVAESETL